MMLKSTLLLLSLSAALWAGGDSGICRHGQAARQPVRHCSHNEQDAVQQGQGARQQGPHIHLDHQTADLGTRSRKQGQQVKHRFTFSNDGDAPLVIEQVEPSCGCTSVTFSRKPVKPGGSGHVTVVFDPASQPPGMFRKSIMVYANVPGGYVRLFIKGTIGN